MGKKGLTNETLNLLMGKLDNLYIEVALGIMFWEFLFNSIQQRWSSIHSSV